MLLRSFKEISLRDPPQQKLKEQNPSFSTAQATGGWDIQSSCQELSIKHKPFASALQSEWGEDFWVVISWVSNLGRLQLQVKKNWCSHLMIPGDLAHHSTKLRLWPSPVHVGSSPGSLAPWCKNANNFYLNWITPRWTLKTCCEFIWQWVFLKPPTQSSVLGSLWGSAIDDFFGSNHYLVSQRVFCWQQVSFMHQSLLYLLDFKW